MNNAIRICLSAWADNIRIQKGWLILKIGIDRNVKCA